jgi:hypothetical protein
VARQWHVIATVGKQQHQTNVFFSQVSKGNFYCQVSPVGTTLWAVNFLKYFLSVVGMSRHTGTESIDNQHSTLSIIRETFTVNTSDE